MTTATLPIQPSILKRNVLPGITTATVLVVIIMLLALGLHLYNAASIGDANAYYTAAVESMLKSWSNFFFVAAEPGGSVTVDKPPLGLWIETLFAYFLGVSGFSVSLPNIIAGIFSIPLLYSLVQKTMGELAGLVAALVMAITPVFLATNRNNTMDGMLVFTLLLAAGAFIKAAETDKLGWLLLGAFIMGLGFNIKMMQAFLPLPAFYALYLFGSKEGWVRKAMNLGIASALLLVLSLAWAVVVDLTPADQRPYIGSSEDNTVMSLMLGHNGASRLLSGFYERGRARLDPAQGSTPQGMSPQNAQIGAGDSNGSGESPFSQETGDPGILRFFIAPLSKQMSWLLPFALISIALVFFGGRMRLPLEAEAHKALALWGGWLLTCLVFFSMVSGIFHAYYAIMLAPPLGAMVGMGFSQLWKWGTDKNWVSMLLIAAVGVTLAFQVFASYQYGERPYWPIVAGLLFIAGSFLMRRARHTAYVTLLGAMLVIPAYWTLMTTISNADINLPTAYRGSMQGSGSDQQPGQVPGSKVNQELIEYLQANTGNIKYLVAVPSSQQGAPLVLATGRPVLYMGGFGGLDDVVSADDLRAMTEKDELLYVWYVDGRGDKPEIAAWLKTSCFVIQQFSEVKVAAGPQPALGSQGQQNARPGPRDQTMSLHMCQ